VHRPTWAATLLSLGASYEEASAIEGDLIEEARTRGCAWFWWQTMLVSLSLVRRALFNAPAQTLLLGYAVYELAVNLQWWGIKPLRHILRFEYGLPDVQVTLAMLGLWMLAGTAIGALLVRFLSASGLRVAVVAILLVQLRMLLLDSPLSIGLVLAFGAVPLLCGCLLAHRANLARLQAPMAGP
jgi:hypothetical protein